MKREHPSNKLKIERPRRATISEKEALKLMKEFSKRTEQFLPQLERARVEVYVPDLPTKRCRHLISDDACKSLSESNVGSWPDKCW